MKHIKGNKGFGLVECVVAMFLICVVLLGMAGHIGVTMAAMQTDKSTSVASSLLQDKVEAIKQRALDHGGPGGQHLGKGSSRLQHDRPVKGVAPPYHLDVGQKGSRFRCPRPSC